MIAFLRSFAPEPEPLGWMPPQASTAAQGIDDVFWLIFWICAFFFGLIMVLTVVFVIKYRERKFGGPGESPSHNTRLELVWSAIPLAIVIFIFAKATLAYIDIDKKKPGETSATVQVTAKRWNWWFDHPGGKGSDELHLILNQPVDLVMNAPDVLHSLYVPAFRLKQDVVPGRYTKLHVTPTVAGTFPLYCAEFCGTNHSLMTTVVVVHPDVASYSAWLKESGYEGMTLLEIGKRVYTKRGCSSCHTTDGTTKPGQGPSFKLLFGKNESFADGTSGTVDENYIRESIVTPTAKVVAGFNPVMPPTVLSEREYQGIIEFIKSQQ